MATVAYQGTSASDYVRDQAFFMKMALGISAFVVFAFAQWSLRGFVDFGRVPVWVHIHALVMVSWLGVFVAQNWLAQSGNIPMHRKLGWLACAVIVAVPLIGNFTAVKSIELHRVPPFFTNAYFLALSAVDSTAFAAICAVAIARRRDTEWHRRLMLVATILLMEPAFGRLLPLPFMGAWGPVAERVLQLAVLGIAMRHDVHRRGSVHPALRWGAAVMIASQVAISLFAANPSAIAFADGLAAG